MTKIAVALIDKSYDRIFYHITIYRVEYGTVYFEREFNKNLHNNLLESIKYIFANFKIVDSIRERNYLNLNFLNSDFLFSYE